MLSSVNTPSLPDIIDINSSNLSATSTYPTFSLKLRIFDPKGITYKNINLEEEILPPVISRKIYIKLHLNGYRVVGLLDSGSDVSIIQHSTYQRLKTLLGELQKSPIATIRSFSNTEINVKGEVHWNFSIHKGAPVLNSQFLIVNNMPGIPEILFGETLMRLVLCSISYTGTPDKPQPFSFSG